MPQFKIRRKRKSPPQTVEEKPAPVEEKVDENEMSESSSDDEFVNEAMEKLSVSNKPQTEQKHVRYQPNPQPRYQTPARTAQQHARNGKYLTNGPGAPVRPNPYYRKTPTGFTQNKRLRGAQKGRIRFRSLYGPNGDAYDTRTQATMLYHACFG